MTADVRLFVVSWISGMIVGVIITPLILDRLTSRTERRPDNATTRVLSWRPRRRGRQSRRSRRRDPPS